MNPEYSIKPPHAIDLEESILGAFLLERDVLDEVIPFIPSDFFYKKEHDIIFKAIHKLYSEGKPVDISTITVELNGAKKLNEVGGAYYITTLANKVTSSANTEYHFFLLMQMYIKRETIQISTQAIKQSYDEGHDIFETLSFLKTNLDGIDDLISRKRTAKALPAIIDEAIEETHARIAKAKQGKIIGVPTGLIDLDRATTGWKGGDVIIVAGRPGMGKTAFGLFFAKKAGKYKHNSCFFSLEMKSIRLVDRLILSESGVKADGFQSGQISEEELNSIKKAADRLKKYPMYIDDNPSANISYIHSICRMKKRRGTCNLIVIDYLQLIEQSGRHQNREAEVASISRKVKKMALDLNVPVILLCQLSRAVEARGGDRRPRLSDLRESGAIEQDADIVIFPYRPDYVGVEDESGKSLEGMGELIISKNRNGKPVDVKFRHNESMNDFFDYAPDNFPIPEDFNEPKRENNLPF